MCQLNDICEHPAGSVVAPRARAWRQETKDPIREFMSSGTYTERVTVSNHNRADLGESTYIYTYIHIYIYTHTHTHTQYIYIYTYIYIYIYIYVIYVPCTTNGIGAKYFVWNSRRFPVPFNCPKGDVAGTCLRPTLTESAPRLATYLPRTRRCWVRAMQMWCFLFATSVILLATLCRLFD